VKREALAHLSVTAHDGSSVIDVHVLRSPGRVGRLLFHGTLERGESQSFVQRNLWLNVSFPKHVSLALNGSSPFRLKGTCPIAVTVTPQQMTTATVTATPCR
jgi:hypothetical protein